MAVECRRDRASGYRSHDQPATGTGIAKIKRHRRLGKTRDPDTIDLPGAFADPLDPGAERPHGFCGVEHILAFEQAGNPRTSHRKTADNQGPMANPLASTPTA